MMHAIKRRGLMMHAIKRRGLMMHAIKRGVAERVLRRSRADNVPHQQRMTSLISSGLRPSLAAGWPTRRQ